MRITAACTVLIFAASCIGDATCHAQDSPTILPISKEILQSEQGWSPVPQEEIELSQFKKQAIQSISITGGALFDGSDDGYDNSFLKFGIGSGIPLGNFDNILGVTPQVRVDFIDAAPEVDIPDELYEFQLQFFYRRAVRERLSSIFILSPSIRSDLTTSDNAFRMFALALLNWECRLDELTLSFGAVVLGRSDLPVLPAVGSFGRRRDACVVIYDSR